MSKLTVPCAYCSRAVVVTLSDVLARSREVGLLTFVCPHCDSKTELYMSSRRKGKGKRFKEAEEIRAEMRRQLIALSATFVDRVAPQLLAQRECECAEHGKRIGGAVTRGGYYYADQRVDGLLDVTGGDGMKGVPRHHNQCPVANTTHEQELRTQLGEELHALLEAHRKERAA